MSRHSARLVGGLIPCALVGAELAAYDHRRRKASRERQEPTALTPGSFEFNLDANASTLDLVFTRRRAWRLGPLTGLASWSCPGLYDSVGAILVDRLTGAAQVLEAHLDGSVSLTPLAARLKDPDCAEVAIRGLAWPDRQSNSEAAHLVATSALLQCAADNSSPRGPWRAAVDSRFAPLVWPRRSWPTADADASLPAKLDAAVSPSATLVVELYVAVGALPPHHKGTACLPADFAESDPPLRKGARLLPPVMVRVANS